VVAQRLAEQEGWIRATLHAPLLPTLGVHVPDGFACASYRLFGRRRKCEPLSAFVPAVRELARQFGFRSVVLVTDSPAVLANATAELAPLPVFTRSDAVSAARRADEARQTGAWAARPMSKHQTDEQAADAYARAADFVVDVLLLARTCSGFVGKFSSVLSRTAYSLMAARCDCLHPFISIDIPWCFGLGCHKDGNEAIKAEFQRRSRRTNSTSSRPSYRHKVPLDQPPPRMQHQSATAGISTLIRLGQADPTASLAHQHSHRQPPQQAHVLSKEQAAKRKLESHQANVRLARFVRDMARFGKDVRKDK